MFAWTRLLAVLALGCTIAIEAQAPADARTGLIVGQVVDGDSGRPVGGAIVSISGARPVPGGGNTLSAPIRVIATSDGRFVLRDLPRGAFGITASKPGYADGAYGRRRQTALQQLLTVAEGERVGDIVIRVWKHGAISGTVVDEAGEPLINTAVRAFRRSATGMRYFTVAAMAVTDDRGIYRLGNLQPAEYVVAVVARHLSLPMSMVTTLTGSADRGIVIPELTGLAVTRPGASTTVQVGNVAYALGGGMPVPPPPDVDRMSVYATTFYPAASVAAQAGVIALGSGEERSAIDFQLRPVPAVRVSGVLTGPLGPTSLPLRLVSADAQEVNLEQDALSTVADRQGNFVFPAVPPGSYSLRSGSPARPPSRPGEPDDMLWADVPVSVGGDDVTGLSVILQPGFRISGRFEFEGNAERPTADRMQQVPVIVEPASPGSNARNPTVAARTDGAGHFTSIGIVPGKYFVRIGGSPTGWRFKTATHEGRDVADVPLDLRGHANVVITFSDRWTSVRGTVTSATGQRDLEAIVLLFPTEVQQWTNSGMNPRRLKSAVVTKPGEYALASVPEGDYYLIAIPDKDAAGWQDPKFLEALAQTATRISVGDGEAKTQDLRTQEVR